MQALPKKEIDKVEKHVFRVYDTNNDGFIDFIEFMVLFHILSGKILDSMLSSTVIGVELHRLGLKFNFGQVEVQRGEAELNFNLTKIELEWSCTR